MYQRRNVQSFLSSLWICVVFAYAALRMKLLANFWSSGIGKLGTLIIIVCYIIHANLIYKAATVAFLSLYLFYQYKFFHWRRHGIPAITPYFPMGNIWSMFWKTPAEVLKEMHDKGKGHKLIGIWFMFRPAILLRDPEVIKNVLVKEFLNFHERGIYINRKNDPLTAHVFNMSGPKWRNLRTKLTPAMSSGKIKAMFPQFVQVAKRFEQVMLPMAEYQQVVDVKELAARFTTDLTTLTALGITTHALTDQFDPFRRKGRLLFLSSIYTIIRSIMPFVMPDLSALLGVISIPQEVTRFFSKAISEIVEIREKNNIQRDDFLGLLIGLKKKGFLEKVDGFNLEGKGTDKDNNFTASNVASEAFVFFAAGFETAALTIAWAIYELAVYPNIQKKVREEIHTILKKYDGDICYQAINEMKYLDQVIDESLRMYSPAQIILRKSSAPYEVPGSGLVIPAGTQVHVSVHGLHRDPEYFPSPDVFDPNRFSDEEKSKRHRYAFIPFGDGPRSCFGMRYSLLQKKMGLVAMLNKYEFSLTEESPYPLKLDPRSFTFAPVGGMKLKISTTQI